MSYNRYMYALFLWFFNIFGRNTYKYHESKNSMIKFYYHNTPLSSLILGYGLSWAYNLGYIEIYTTFNMVFYFLP